MSHQKMTNNLNPIYKDSISLNGRKRQVLVQDLLMSFIKEKISYIIMMSLLEFQKRTTLMTMMLINLLSNPSDNQQLLILQSWASSQISAILIQFKKKLIAAQHNMLNQKEINCLNRKQTKYQLRQVLLYNKIWILESTILF